MKWSPLVTEFQACLRRHGVPWFSNNRFFVKKSKINAKLFGNFSKPVSRGKFENYVPEKCFFSINKSSRLERVLNFLEPLSLLKKC